MLILTEISTIFIEMTSIMDSLVKELLSVPKVKALEYFLITFDRNKIETCGFQLSIVKTQEHIFISKVFSEETFAGGVFPEFLKNNARVLKTAIRIY